MSFIIFSVDFLFLLHHLEYAVMLYIKLTEKVAKNLELKLLCKIEKNVCAGAMMDDTKKNNKPKHQMQNCLKTINHMPKCWQMKLSSYQSATHSKWNVDKQKKYTPKWMTASEVANEAVENRELKMGEKETERARTLEKEDRKMIKDEKNYRRCCLLLHIYSILSL